MANEHTTVPAESLLDARSAGSPVPHLAKKGSDACVAAREVLLASGVFS